MQIEHTPRLSSELSGSVVRELREASNKTSETVQQGKKGTKRPYSIVCKITVVNRAQSMILQDLVCSTSNLSPTATPYHIPLSLKISLASEALILDQLNPVVIGIKNKRNVLHAAIRQSLLPVDLETLQTLASSLDVINRHAYFIVSNSSYSHLPVKKKKTHKYDQTLEAGRCRYGTKSSHPSRYHSSTSTPTVPRDPPCSASHRHTPGNKG